MEFIDINDLTWPEREQVLRNLKHPAEERSIEEWVGDDYDGMDIPTENGNGLAHSFPGTEHEPAVRLGPSEWYLEQNARFVDSVCGCGARSEHLGGACVDFKCEHGKALSLAFAEEQGTPTNVRYCIDRLLAKGGR